jgi:ABC-type enterobactin transport system permease subunit
MGLGAADFAVAVVAAATAAMGPIYYQAARAPSCEM